MRSLAVVAALAATSALHVADVRAEGDRDAVEWLERIYSASERLSYRGTFVYQHDDEVETSRVTRVVDSSGVRERLEALDGTPREIIRVNDELKCYLPATMTVKVERGMGTKPFPFRRADMPIITQQYDIRKGMVERTAGRDCQAIILVPKDNLRYGHKLCADVESGLLVTAKTFNDRGKMVERFSFTQLAIGGSIDNELLRSRYASEGGGWRVEDHAAAAVDLEEFGWTINELPAGFRRVTTLRRDAGNGHSVGQIVVSDGLAAVSVFIEPLGVRAQPPQLGISRQGAVNIYSRELDEHLVTAVGEVPAESVRRIAGAVARRTPR
ncbi:MAG: MucB/RseB C-terminal domain-containing protein [Betaproteobacteria bacterium]|jgi:sigma-E factor negative regulatory protein RseB|nr:MucB/RseB C-terminal domain-containing protein [Betaproteobacteria bacterium]